MPTDRPGGPDTPDHDTPDPARPPESPGTPTEPGHPGHQRYPLNAPREDTAAGGSRGGAGDSASGAGGFEHHPLPPYPEDEPPRPGDAESTSPSPEGSTAGRNDPTPALPTESGSGSVPAGGPSGYQPTVPLPAPAEPPRRGSMTTQEAGITQPRPPTVAEARAREKARRRAEEQERAEAEAAEAKQRKKKRVLIGGAAVVGIAALVGGGYLVASAWNGPEVTASCTVVANKGEVVPTGNGQSVTATQDNQEIVVPDNYCSDAQSHGDGGVHPGFFFLAGHSYRYYYGGGNQTIGRPPTGGTTVAPKGATIKTKSGSTIQRGGLGAKIGGGS